MGSTTNNNASRFLQDIPSHLIVGRELWRGGESKFTDGIYSWHDTSAFTVDLPELKTGDQVYHRQFGQGVVVNCKPLKNDSEVVVAFRGVGVKKLLLSFAQLERLE